MATTGINVQNIGMSYGKDWQSLNEEGLADTLGYGAKRKQDIKNKLIGGAIEYAGNMFKPVPPPEAQAPVPSGGLGSNLGQSLNQFPNQIASQPAPNAEVQQTNDAPEDVDKFVKDIVPKQIGSFTGALDEIGNADALASMGDAASMFAFV